MTKEIKILKLSFNQKDIKWIQKEVGKSLKSGQLSLGNNVKNFENNFLKFTKSKYSVATNNGTSALEIIYRSINVKDKEVILPSNTFIATAFAIIAAGGKPIFVDCNKETLCIDPKDLQKKITKKTKAVTIVHIGGIITPEIDEIIKICKINKLSLIEDAAHAHGSSYKNHVAGSIGIAAAFSFYPTKIITTCEGGIITTKNKKIKNDALLLRNFGTASRYNHTKIGNNSRLSEIHSIIGLNQIKNLKKILSKRREIALIYDNAIKKMLHIDNYKYSQNQNSSYYKYIVKTNKKISYKKIYDLFKKKNIILPGKVYGKPLHKQPVFKKYKNLKLPETENICRSHFCLPMYPSLNKNEINRVIETLNELNN